MQEEEKCKPKIIRYYEDYHNLNYDYNCEECDNVDCEHWQEWHNDK